MADHKIGTLLLTMLVGAQQICAEGPEQRHLALASSGRMAVVWRDSSTGVPQNQVYYGTSKNDLSMKAIAADHEYSCQDASCGGSVESPYYSGHLYRALLGTSQQPLTPGVTYFYRCGNETDPIFSFVMPSSKIVHGHPVTFSVVGDLGQTEFSKRTVQHMQSARPAVVVDAGDLSYADCLQPRWDTYGRLVEPLAASVPWMPVHGNHEVEPLEVCGQSLGREFRAYEERYRLPFEEAGSTSPHWYSFEASGVHWLMLGSYVDWTSGSQQMKWLQKDLKAIDKAKTPWLIAVVHAPWYSSNQAHQHEWQSDGMRQALEGLLRSNGLDAMFAGHVHSYERVDRIFDGASDSCAPAYFNIGDGGNREGLYNHWFKQPPKWSKFREASYGHVRLTVHNATHAHYSWHRHQTDAADVNPIMSDELWLVKHASCNVRHEAPATYGLLFAVGGVIVVSLLFAGGVVIVVSVAYFFDSRRQSIRKVAFIGERNQQAHHQEMSLIDNESCSQKLMEGNIDAQS